MMAYNMAGSKGVKTVLIISAVNFLLISTLFYLWWSSAGQYSCPGTAKSDYTEETNNNSAMASRLSECDEQDTKTLSSQIKNIQNQDINKNKSSTLPAEYLNSNGTNNKEAAKPGREDEMLKEETNRAEEPFIALAGYKRVFTTLFWVGERADESNGYIPNRESNWDGRWQENYGGIDAPSKRCGYLPCSFMPKENPFYFALPYSDFEDDGTAKKSVREIPWYGEAGEYKTILKNYWIEIVYNNKICYAQWEDVGPFETDDFSYVFGDAKPRNTKGVGSGLDLSPAAWDCLGLEDNGYTSWRFVAENEVPDGPWKKTITVSGYNY